MTRTPPGHKVSGLAVAAGIIAVALLIAISQINKHSDHKPAPKPSVSSHR